MTTTTDKLPTSFEPTEPAHDGLKHAREYSLKELREAVQKIPQTPMRTADSVTATHELNKLIDPGLTEGDQRTMRELDSAFVSGDSKRFAKAVERFKDDPDELRKFTGMLNDNLTKLGSTVHVAVNGESVLILGQDKAIEVSTDGRATVRGVKQIGNGSAMIGDQIYDINVSHVMKTLGLDAAHDIVQSDYMSIPQLPGTFDRIPRR